MRSNRKVFVSIIVILIIVLVIFLKEDWEIIQLKYGLKKPIIWENSTETDNVLLIDIEDHYIEDLRVHITDLYYLPNLKRLHFGLWYYKWHYSDEDIPAPVFHFEFVDNNGNVDDKNTHLPNSGILENFQYRFVKNIDLSKKDTLYMNIYTLHRSKGKWTKGEPIKMLIYTSDTVTRTLNGNE